MIMTTDDDRLWFDDVVWTRTVWRRLRGDRVSLTASATIAMPTPDRHAADTQAARRRYVQALTEQVHPPKRTKRSARR